MKNIKKKSLLDSSYRLKMALIKHCIKLDRNLNNNKSTVGKDCRSYRNRYLS